MQNTVRRRYGLGHEIVFIVFGYLTPRNVWLKPELLIVDQLSALVHFEFDILHVAIANRSNGRADHHSGSPDSRLDDGKRLVTRTIHARRDLANRHVRTRLQVKACDIEWVVAAISEKIRPFDGVQDIGAPLG